MTPAFRDTGSPPLDAQTDFSRARRRRVLDRLAARMRREPRDFHVILPFEEVVEAVGYRGERQLGLQTIGLDSIVGTVGRERDFDRRFRPTSRRTRKRWERMATAARRGESFPPIEVYRIGDVHFVKDGHHRVSIARAQGLPDIDAYVTEVYTELGADHEITLRDLPLKSHQRLFFERVPLPADARGRIELSDEKHFAMLAEQVEAWGFRLIQERREPLDRRRGRRALVPGGVRARRRDAARGGADRQADRDGGLHGRLRPALHAAAHPRLGRPGDRAAAPGAALAGPERAAVVRIEELDVRDVDPELDLLALLGARLGRQPRRHLTRLS